MNNSTRFTATLISLAFAGAVAAQAPATGTTSPGVDHTGAGHSNFTSVDMNQDGRISQAEARSHSELQAAFAQLDQDRDNYLSKDEYARWDAAGKGSKMKPKSEIQSESQSEEAVVPNPPAEADPVIE